jgi:hypothetical protein
MPDEKRVRPEIDIPGVDLNDYRKLGTSLRPGEYKQLYTGVIVVNTGYSSANLRILTPKSEDYEQLLEDFRQNTSHQA